LHNLLIYDKPRITYSFCVCPAWACSAHEVEAVEKDQKYKFIFDS